jgi:acyl-coenzyme A thioesterase PaaI-like protein
MTTSEKKSTPDSQKTASFIKKFMNPLNQWLFLFAKLPAALFMGVKVVKLDTEKSVVTVPYRWRSQNPFKSTYFAAQAAAAEMSTGILCSLAIHGRGKISMLITDMRAEYIKKVNKKATFTCSMGPEVFEMVAKAIETGEGQTLTMESIGTMPGEDGKAVVVSKFYFTWSVKAKG